MLIILFEKILTILDNFSQYKNFNFIKKNYGNIFDTFFDVGCHKGETVDLVNKIFLIKKIYAFDADANLIKRNKKSNPENVSFIDSGVGDFNGVKKMYKHKFSPINSLNNENYNSKYGKKRNRLLNFLYGNTERKKEIKINVIKLDTFIKSQRIRKVDILKIDTEGYEFNVVKGLSKEINRVRIILFEHHFDNLLIKNYKFSDINNFLQNNGFIKVYKTKMLFRKIFEYIYINKSIC